VRCMRVTGRARSGASWACLCAASYSRSCACTLPGASRRSARPRPPTRAPPPWRAEPVILLLCLLVHGRQRWGGAASLSLTRCCMYGPSPDPQQPRATAGAPACVRTVRCWFSSQRTLSAFDARASCASGIRSLAARVSWRLHGLSVVRCPAMPLLLGCLPCILAPALGGSCSQPARRPWFGMCLAGWLGSSHPVSERACKHMTERAVHGLPGCSLHCHAGLAGW